MILHYIKFSVNRILKNPVSSGINILGLVIGITSFFILFIYVANEKSFDKHFNGYKNIYRVISSPVEVNTQWARSLGFIYKATENIPEVEEASQFSYCPIGTINIDEMSLQQEDIMSVDIEFMHIFEVESKLGDLADISEPNTVFISEDFAKKYFGNENPIGKIIKIESLQYLQDLGDFQIRGIVKNTNPKTHFNYHLLLSQKGALQERYSSLPNLKIQWVYNYVKIKDGASPKVIANKLQSMFDESSLRQTRGPQDYKFSLTAIEDIHLKSDCRFEMKENTSTINIDLFFIISFIILFVSLINFINLNIAKLIKRSKGLGVIKTFGASNRKLNEQVLIDTLILSITAIAISLIGLELISPIINRHFDLDFKIYYSEPIIYFVVIGVLFLCGALNTLVAGNYLLRNTSTINLINGKKNTSGNFVLKSLLILQMSIVIILISGTLIVNKQINFITSRSLGFEKENVIVIHLKDFSKDPAVFADELKKQSQIISVGFTRQYFGYPAQNISLEGMGLEGSAEFVFANYDYLKTMNIQFIHNWISPSADTVEGMVVNEHLYKRLMEKHGSIESLKAFYEQQNTEEDFDQLRFIGVTKDFNYGSVHKTVGDFAFYLGESRSRARFTHVRVNPRDIWATIKTIEVIWDKHYNGQEFNYFFMDEKIAQQYKAETILRKILFAFSVLGLIISIIGISALTYFISQQRTKEIGIRKVNGATIMEILIMLNMDVVKWVAIAFIIATPIAYYFSQKWLQNFAFKTSISWWIFALAGFFAISIALITVSWQTYKAASRNPIEALRYE